MKNIPFASKYLIDRHGNIFRERRGCLQTIKSRVDTSTYKRVMLYTNEGKAKTYLVHRLVAITYLDNPDNLPCVNHIDGNKLNNKVENLEWCSHSYNMKHAFSLGLKSNLGECNPRSQIREEDVISCYKMLLDGARVCDIHKKFGYTKDTINKIKNKITWKHLLQDFPDIPSKPKSEKLSEQTVRWVCSKLEQGSSVPGIVREATNVGLKEDTVYDIKRRRCYTHISSEYNW